MLREALERIRAIARSVKPGLSGRVEQLQAIEDEANAALAASQPEPVDPGFLMCASCDKALQRPDDPGVHYAYCRACVKALRDDSNDMQERLNAYAAQPEPACEKCGGSGEIAAPHPMHPEDITRSSRKPCRDCKQEAPDG
jgi:hypothetical protein